MCNLFSVDCIAFTVLNYPMSYIELVGTLLFLWSAWLVARKNILTWPTGILSVILYLILFYQIRLYSDAFEQVYTLGMSIYGWIIWAKKGQVDEEKEEFFYSTRRTILISLAVTGAGTLVMWAFTSRIHLILPALFPQPASYPFLDSLTTVMTFTATWLMARKRVESWVYWIVVDFIGVGLYYIKDVHLIALLYLILLGMAVYGLWNWAKKTNIYQLSG